MTFFGLDNRHRCRALHYVAILQDPSIYEYRFVPGLNNKSGKTIGRISNIAPALTSWSISLSRPWLISYCKDTFMDKIERAAWAKGHRGTHRLTVTYFAVQASIQVVKADETEGLKLRRDRHTSPELLIDGEGGSMLNLLSTPYLAFSI